MLEKNKAPIKELYLELVRKIDFKVEVFFLEFIKQHDGAEGVVSGNDFLMLWNIEDLIALNPYYQDVEDCEKMLFFGSNGSNFGYALDKQTGSVVGIDFLEIGLTSPQIIAESFEVFFKNMNG